MSEYKIMIVDDEPDILDLLEKALTIEGFHNILKVDSGNSAVSTCKKENPDVIILDVMLPDIDGYEVCKRIRQFSHCPILFLSSKNDEVDKILGLAVGGDDYVTKPFSVPELMARVKTNMRRAPLFEEKEKLIVFEDITMDLTERKVRRGDNYLHLSPTEFRLLKMLLKEPGKVFSREVLLKSVWGENIYVESRTVDVHIRRLRKSLNDFGPDYIRTVRATGYAIDINPVGDQEEPADN